MMKTVLSSIVLLVIVAFTAMNASSVLVSLGFWSLNVSLAIVIAGSFLLGFVFGLLRLVPSVWRQRTQVKEKEQLLSRLKESVSTLESENKKLRGQAAQLQETVQQ